MKLTIILTVYNKDSFLDKSFSALLNQRGAEPSDYEILAVNDGSNDCSAAILEEYAGRDGRVRVLTQQNQGLSMARNNGVVAAKGEYVWFVDADDIISTNAVKLICQAIDSNPDVIPIYAKTDGKDSVRNAVDVNSKTGKDVLKNGHWEQCGVFWILQRKFLLENNLRFMPGVYHEDAEFTPRMLYAAETVKIIPEVLYTVFVDANGITQVPRAKRAFDYLIVAESISKFVLDNGEKGTKIGRSIDYYTAQYINNALCIIVQNNKEEQRAFEEKFYEKRSLLLRPLRAVSNLKYRIEEVMFKVFPKHYICIYKLMKRL